ncbi:PREDICTED: uncharacterized protein LOC104778935 [Camelina sativa]|uniref:Uncharacterized protein LOC104778935 n=1 Tax=Camelina sativa TaxID=90675 RepID=A0ABM1R9G5_CAMSA|nr:PREDICTED: uncharacterized protein LOC104778935 [Camelina sativa]
MPFSVTEKDYTDGVSIGDVLLLDAAKEELLTVPDKTVPAELANSGVVGASHGWGFFCNRQDRSVRISDFFSPFASKSNPTMIPLPPFTALHACQTENVWNVAMSSSPPDQDDGEEWVVGIQFLGNQLSICSPRRDLRWTNIEIPFGSLLNSNLMYSKRDQTFNMPAPGGNYMCSWDLLFRQENYPKVYELLFHNLPELPQSSWELLDSCLKEDHWVESPSGESFLVKWYSPVSSPLSIFMVFREEETNEGRRNMCYTEDIGDMCIFLSKSEAFCVQASSFPGLKPNSIYHIGRGVAVYDLTAKSVSHFELIKGEPKEIPPSIPYWLPPFSI